MPDLSQYNAANGFQGFNYDAQQAAIKRQQAATAALQAMTLKQDQGDFVRSPMGTFYAGANGKTTGLAKIASALLSSYLGTSNDDDQAKLDSLSNDALAYRMDSSNYLGGKDAKASAVDMGTPTATALPASQTPAFQDTNAPSDAVATSQPVDMSMPSATPLPPSNPAAAPMTPATQSVTSTVKPAALKALNASTPSAPASTDDTIDLNAPIYDADGNLLSGTPLPAPTKKVGLDRFIANVLSPGSAPIPDLPAQPAAQPQPSPLVTRPIDMGNGNGWDAPQPMPQGPAPTGPAPQAPVAMPSPQGQGAVPMPQAQPTPQPSMPFTGSPADARAAADQATIQPTPQEHLQQILAIGQTGPLGQRIAQAQLDQMFASKNGRFKTTVLADPVNGGFLKVTEDTASGQSQNERIGSSGASPKVTESLLAAAKQIDPSNPNAVAQYNAMRAQYNLPPLDAQTIAGMASTASDRKGDAEAVTQIAGKKAEVEQALASNNKLSDQLTLAKGYIDKANVGPVAHLFAPIQNIIGDSTANNFVTQAMNDSRFKGIVADLAGQGRIGQGEFNAYRTDGANASMSPSSLKLAFDQYTNLINQEKAAQEAQLGAYGHALDKLGYKPMPPASAPAAGSGRAPGRYTF